LKFNRAYMLAGTGYLLIPKVVGDNTVHDCSHGAFLLGGHLSQLLQFIIGYKAYDPVWARDIGG
jgi:hypothetical protein